MFEPSVVNLMDVDRTGADGAVWSLAHGGDLDANLVHLGPGATVATHVNDEVDVLVVCVVGSGSVSVDAAQLELRPGTVVAIPKGTERAIAAGADTEVAYLTVHRARPGLRIGR